MIHRRLFSTRTIDRCIMSPIFYVNAAPHIGHLYTALYCDAAARHARSQGKNVLFSIGTDEHGLKIQKKASIEGKTPLELCDQNSATFEKLFKAAELSHDIYIRTTSPLHKESVQSFWNKLNENKAISLGSHTGFYSTNDETFVVEKDLIKEGEHFKTQAGEVCE